MKTKVIVNDVIMKALARGAMSVTKDMDSCKIEIGSGKCILSTADGKAAVSTAIGCETEGLDENISIYTSFVKLNVAVSEMFRVSDTVTFDIDDKKFVVSNRMASIELPLLQEDSFINVEVAEQASSVRFAIDGHVLKHALLVASSCTSNKVESTSYVGIRIYKNGTLDVGAISNYTVGLVQSIPVTFIKGYELGETEWKDLMIFNARAKALAGVIPSGEPVTIQARGNAGYFIFGDKNIQSIIILPLSTVNGGEWKIRESLGNVLGQLNTEYYLKGKRKDLDNALSMIFCGSKIADGDNEGKYGIYISAKEKALHLDSVNGNTNVEVPCEASGNWPDKVKYNATLVKDVVSLLEGSEITAYTTEKGEMLFFREGATTLLVLGIK